MNDNHMISCVCITKNRVPLLKRAIASYLAQTYANKELLIVYEDNDTNTKNFLSTLSTPGIRAIEIPWKPELTLGALRNFSIQESRGEFFCQWDDDDWCHQNRLEFQMDVIKKSKMSACVLMHWLVFDTVTDKAYISPFWHWEGSVLCAKKVIHEGFSYENKKRGEDTPFIKQLFKNHMVFPVLMPKLYIYVYHSKNTWEYEHWQNNIIRKSNPLSDSSSRLIKGILDNKYSVREASFLLDNMTE